MNLVEFEKEIHDATKAGGKRPKLIVLKHDDMVDLARDIARNYESREGPFTIEDIVDSIASGTFELMGIQVRLVSWRH